MKENWFLLGDIHGNVEPIQKFYNKNKDKLNPDVTKNHMILLGDVGANFALTGSRDHRFKEELSRIPMTFICLRGNHDARVHNAINRNPEGWVETTKYQGTIFIEKEFPNIEYVNDLPAVYEFNGYKTLSLPGAYSVDKWYRLNNHWTWHEDEQLTEQEMQIGRDLCKQHVSFDLVISHTCPMIYEPTDLFISGLDQSMVDKSMERFLGEIEFSVDYKRWAFGHFHADRLYPWNNGRQMLMLFNTRVVDLNNFMHMTATSSLDDISA